MVPVIRVDGIAMPVMVMNYDVVKCCGDEGSLLLCVCSATLDETSCNEQKQNAHKLEERLPPSHASTSPRPIVVISVAFALREGNAHPSST
jgi:hypothetical protein